MSTNSLSSEESVEKKIFDKIQELQSEELKLYNQLESQSVGNPDPTEISQTIKSIEKTTSLRNTLYEKLQNDLNNNKKNIGNLSSHLQDQANTTQVLEQQLQEAKKRADKIKSGKTDALRMIELGKYEASRYNAHKNLIKLIIYFILGIIVVTLLLKYNIIPSVLGSGLITLLVAVGLIMVGMKAYDLSNRSNLNYDQYNWGFDRDQANKGYESVWQFDERAFEKVEGEVEGEIPGLNDPKFTPGLMTTIYESDADGKVGKYLKKRISPTVNYPYGIEVVSDRKFDYYIKFTGLVLHKPNYKKIKFRVGSDDGSRLTVNGRVEINNWRLEGYEKKTSRELQFTSDMPIELEMYQHRGGRAVTLEWKVNDNNWEIIPAKHLVHIQ